MAVSSPITFDNLFFKRLQHIERVLDEDPMELDKFKTYFNSLRQTKTSLAPIKPLSNILLFTNNSKEYANILNQIDTNKQRAESTLNMESSLGIIPSSHRRGASTLETYQGPSPSGDLMVGGASKKVVYQVK